ncbi:MAG: xanthine dehydrogenase accessory protein XdhC [Paracoccaceae bacterium]
MRLDLLQAAFAAQGPFTRVLVAEARGSTPREAGAELRVWPGRFEGTIGGGALEHEALAAARAGRLGAERLALGPARGQCCGGAVVLGFERIDAGWLARATAQVAETGSFARPLKGAPCEMPLAVRRALARARDRGATPKRLIEGWLVEAAAAAPAPLWIWGAGHVGRALVGVLAPLPEFEISWIDTAENRFPAEADGLRRIIAPRPAEAVTLALPETRHLIVTYSHVLDLELCHALLGHGFAGLGLIGSASKWARFRGRLRMLGHSDAQIARITCPIGEPTLGKHPQAIALGVATALLKDKRAAEPASSGQKQEGRAG